MNLLEACECINGYQDIIRTETCKRCNRKYPITKRDWEIQNAKNIVFLCNTCRKINRKTKRSKAVLNSQNIGVLKILPYTCEKIDILEFIKEVNPKSDFLQCIVKNRLEKWQISNLKGVYFVSETKQIFLLHKNGAEVEATAIFINPKTLRIRNG